MVTARHCLYQNGDPGPLADILEIFGGNYVRVKSEVGKLDPGNPNVDFVEDDFEEILNVEKDMEVTDEENCENQTVNDYYPVDPKNASCSLIVGLRPSLLPFPVDFMNHEELYKWLIDEIWQDAARRGVQAKSSQVKFKDLRFKPVWWLEEIWPWGITTHFSKVTKLIWSELGLGCGASSLSPGSSHPSSPADTGVFRLSEQFWLPSPPQLSSPARCLVCWPALSSTERILQSGDLRTVGGSSTLSGDFSRWK